MKRASALLLAALCLALLLPTASAQEILPLDKITNQEELNKTVAALGSALFDSYTRRYPGNHQPLKTAKAGASSRVLKI